MSIFLSLPLSLFWRPVSLSSQNILCQHLIPTLTFYPAWKNDHIDLYHNSVYCSPENISGHFGFLFHWRHINFNITYLFNLAIVLLRNIGPRRPPFSSRLSSADSTVRHSIDAEEVPLYRSDSGVHRFRRSGPQGSESGQAACSNKQKTWQKEPFLSHS